MGLVGWIRSINEFTNSPFVLKLTQNILPKIEPILWLNLLIFHLGSYSTEEENEDKLYSRVKYFCKRSINFLILGRMLSGVGNPNSPESIKRRKNDEALQTEETIFILKQLYPKFFNTKEELTNVIETIKRIESEKLFETNSNEYRKLKRLETGITLFYT